MKKPTFTIQYFNKPTLTNQSLSYIHNLSWFEFEQIQYIINEYDGELVYENF